MAKKDKKKISPSKTRKSAKKPAKSRPKVKRPLKKVAKKQVKNTKKQKTVKKPLKKAAAKPVKKKLKKQKPIKKVKTVRVVKKQVKPKKATKTVSKKQIKQVKKVKAAKTIKKPAVILKPKAQTAKKSRNVFEPAQIAPYKTKAGEKYMSEKQLNHFRDLLNQWKEELVKEMGKTVQHMQDDAANYPDPIDRASQEEGFSLELRARDRERKLIRKIDEALERIQDGNYGYCEDCGAEIGVQRLEARPTATQCIECKTVAEIKEKQISG